MLTEDIQLSGDGSWTVIQFTSTDTIVYNGSWINMMYRFGSTSTSSGMLLNMGDTIIAQENIYIRPANLSAAQNGVFSVTVTR